MAASQRYAGNQLTLVLNATTISGDYTKFDFAQTAKLEARTAANDTSESFNLMYKQGSGTISFFDNGAVGGLLNTLNTYLGVSTSLTVYPQGIGSVGSGLPVFQMPIIIEESVTRRPSWRGDLRSLPSGDRCHGPPETVAAEGR